jgi:glutamate formiminotransferase / formiminotetrahydrofolate cyclodeaminase
MSALVECVPNFSEGRDLSVIEAIGSAIRAVEGVRLLSVEPDKDYNRTVVTFVGAPDGVVEAAFQATRVAAERIDMAKHTGEHPRIGATDVVPFVPVSGISMEECVHLARRYGKRVGDELKIPIYLYEEAATLPERRNLASVRKGEYEGLTAKLADPAWKPDFGPAEFSSRSGATVTGARVFLIAYNVNLNTNDQKVAHEIALRIRESGRVKKDAGGNVVTDARGQKVVIPGTLKAVKAMGVLLEAHNIAQVSINLINFHVTAPHQAFEEVKRQARELGVDVTGSEIVGLTPKEALLMAGKFYAPDTVDEERLIGVAVDRLGLSQLDRFDPTRKVIEYQLL